MTWPERCSRSGDGGYGDSTKMVDADAAADADADAVRTSRVTNVVRGKRGLVVALTNNLFNLIILN